jgi:hypothetical protein
MTTALIKFHQASALHAEIKGDIIRCASVGDAEQTSGKARLVEDLLRECGAACELRLDAAETMIYAEANLGRWLKQRHKGRPRNGCSEHPFPKIEKRREDRCRCLASSNGQLEHTIRRIRAAIYDRAAGRELREGDLRSMSVAGVRRELEQRPVKERSLLRPSDLWVFNPPRYGRIDEDNGYGYLPGDVYCNILWQWSRSGEVVADVMAGSGMIRHVYDRRGEWLPEGESLDLKLKLFDLRPRGPHKKEIRRHDARNLLPCAPDLIIMDVPYFAISQGCYSEDERDVANATNPLEWLAMLGDVARVSFASQALGGRCCVVVASAYLDTSTGERFQAGTALLSTFVNAGYSLADRAHFGRAIQATGGRQMPFVNADAVKKRWLLSEMTDVWLFVR